jgi:hypothetical protein
MPPPGRWTARHDGGLSYDTEEAAAIARNAAEHTVQLYETHDIRLPVAGYDVNAIVAVADLAAKDWLAAHDLDADTMPISRSDGTAGVTFTLTLGRGPAATDGSDAVGDAFVWSARIGHWLDLLTRGAKPARAARRSERLHARPDGNAHIIALPTGGQAHRALFGTGPAPDFSGFSDPAE